MLEVAKEENVSGDRKVASQGFGRVNAGFAVHFEPQGQGDAACDYFEKYGFVVLDNCLTPAEIGHLNEFYDRTQRERSEVSTQSRNVPFSAK